MRAIEELPTVYADFYRVCGEGVLIMGFGKSRAGRVAAAMDPENCLGADSIELARSDRAVYARDTMGERHGRALGGRYSTDWTRVNFLSRCLNEGETERAYAAVPLEIRDLELSRFVNACRFSVTFPTHTGEYAERRMTAFRELLDGAVLGGLLIVPWIESSEAKGIALREHVCARQRDATTS